MSSTDSGVTKGTAMEKAQGIRASEVSPLSGASMSSTRVFLFSTIPSIITMALLHIVRSRSNPFRIPLFDDSPSLISGGDHVSIRWDAIHFTAIASRGYEYEQQLAFQPGWQGVLWLAGRVWRLVIGGDPVDSISSGGTILVVLLAGWRGLALYNLTAQITTPRKAYLTWILYLLAPSPAILASLYTEPLFACLTFSGFGMILRRRYYAAAILLAGATSVRATGVLAAPTLAIMAVFRDGIYRISLSTFMRRAMAVALPCLIIVTPFFAFQYYAYLSFCRPEASGPWCNDRIPIAYSAVQAKYWNIGFMNYWTLDSIPNFLLASPVLGISLLGLYRYTRSRTTLPAVVTPLVVLHGVMTFLLIFQSHTQIVLRVVSTDPVFWWLLTDISFKDVKGLTRIGRAWIWWTVIWGAISIVLWAGHYPPA